MVKLRLRRAKRRPRRPSAPRSVRRRDIMDFCKNFNADGRKRRAIIPAV